MKRTTGITKTIRYQLQLDDFQQVYIVRIWLFYYSVFQLFHSIQPLYLST